jgi:hypothetical protein
MSDFLLESLQRIHVTIRRLQYGNRRTPGSILPLLPSHASEYLPWEPGSIQLTPDERQLLVLLWQELNQQLEPEELMRRPKRFPKTQSPRLMRWVWHFRKSSKAAARHASTGSALRDASVFVSPGLPLTTPRCIRTVRVSQSKSLHRNDLARPKPERRRY